MEQQFREQCLKLGPFDFLCLNKKASKVFLKGEKTENERLSHPEFSP